jgi:hypothetical protein
MTPANKQTEEAMAIIRKNGLPDLRTYSDLERFHSIYRPEKFNILLPQFINFSPGTKVSLNVVMLDPTTDKYGNGRHFWVKDGKFNPRSVALKIIASNAGINWVLDKFGVIDSEYTSSLTRITFQAAGFMMNYNGKLKSGIGTYQYNSQHDMDNPRFKKKKTDAQGKTLYDKNDRPILSSEADIGQINRRRGTALQLCESGAMSRVIYYLLVDGLDRNYTKDDAGKPFLVPCPMDDVDPRDPIIRTLIAERSLGMTRDIYGPNAAVPTSFEVIPDNKPKPVTQEKPTEELSIVDQREIYLDPWELASHDERAKEVITLATKSKMDMSKRSAPITWTKEKQLQWITMLAEKLGIIPAIPPEVK